MGNCRLRGGCGCCGNATEEQDNKFQPGGDNDLSSGPAKNRACTDVACVILFLAAQVVFILVTVHGFKDGDPAKLWRPRDFRGAYCGVEENWNGGPVTGGMPVQSYTMNLTSVVDEVMKQLVCSTAARGALVDGDAVAGIEPLLNTSAARDAYLCHCCLAPCALCSGSLDKGLDLGLNDVAAVISGKMGELTGVGGGGAALFAAGSFNEDLFSTDAFWGKADQHFNKVCLPTCGDDFRAVANATEHDHRDYVYSPDMDDPLHGAWEAIIDAEDNILTGPLLQAVEGTFTFRALPESTCPYEPANCVPMPGVMFAELGAGSCKFELSTDVVEVVGGYTAEALESIGGNSIMGATKESFGKWAGDFQQTIDSFILVSVIAFAVGLVFIVILRLTIGCCVWLSVVVTVLMFILGGFVVFSLGVQCRGDSVLDASRQVGMAIFGKGQIAFTNIVSDEEPVSEEMEAGLSGTDYVGRQHRTKNGRPCQVWDDQTTFPEYNSMNFPNASLEENRYCRNPWTDDSIFNARTIWCVTSDPEKPWEECAPIGVIRPICHDGHAIEAQSMRRALTYISYVIWGLGVIWIVIVICLVKRIQLAVALNQVAATFVAGNPKVILIPIVQALWAILWTAVWCFAASFLLSQVPDGYTPKGHYATYEEAYGTSGGCAFWEFGERCQGVPGACTDRWPTGQVWKDSDCAVDEDGTPMCWRCAPPRYIFDLRFAASFFVLLWNNAFNVALGQMLIAMCVGIWFFSAQKGGVRLLRPALGTIFRYHIGTVAFGSLLVAIVQFVRWVMKYFEKQAQASKNRFMACLLRCLQCCLWCFEKILKFLNKNAYIQVALLGNNFCTSAKKAFFLILRNALRFGTLAAISGIVHAIGLLCIMAGTLVSGYFVTRAMHPDVEPLIPMLCYAIVSYVVARLYMNVFGLAVDTSIHCFLAVEEMGVGKDLVPSVLTQFIDSNSG